MVFSYKVRELEPGEMLIPRSLEAQRLQVLAQLVLREVQHLFPESATMIHVDIDVRMSSACKVDMQK